MRRTPKSLRVAFIPVVIATLMSLRPDSSVAQSSATLTSFVTQYRALRDEGLDLWRTCQSADITQDERLLSLQRQILDYQKRLASFSHGVQGNILQSQRDALSRRQDPGSGHSYVVVARAADAMKDLLGFASDYLSVKNTVYLRVALKYEEAWRLLDVAIQ